MNITVDLNKQMDAFFKATHCINHNGAVCRIVNDSHPHQVGIELLNGQQTTLARTEISPIKPLTQQEKHHG